MKVSGFWRPALSLSVDSATEENVEKKESKDCDWKGAERNSDRILKKLKILRLGSKYLPVCHWKIKFQKGEVQEATKTR